MIARFIPARRQVVWGLVAAVVACAALLGVAYARTSIPSPTALAAAQTTTLYYSDGHTVLARVGAANRIDVPLSEVPKRVQHAVLAAEDRNFYSEPGISATGIMRALFDDLRGGDISQGGSTITQQYVKNAYLSAQRSFTRKIKEILIALKLGQVRSKATILDDYLNTIYFGRNAYGIQAAAKAYFGRSVSQLTTAQGALLAAVINGPGIYDPQINPHAAHARWDYVINGMVTEHWLSARHAKRLHFPATQQNAATTGCSRGYKAFICNAVRDELITDDGITQAQWELGGLKVVTTINRKAQHAARDAENQFVTNHHGRPESGLVSIKPGDGAIEAMWGGREYCKHLTSDDCVDLTGIGSSFARPPGSSMKPYTLIAALKQGISLNDTEFPGSPHIPFPGTTTGISNAGGEACSSPCTLTRALAQSINTVFVPLAQKVGPTNVDEVAYDSGIPKSTKLSKFPEVSLGTEPVSVLDQAVGYATIAAKGIAAKPYLISSVKVVDGTTIYRAHPSTHRAYSESVAAQATYAMTKVLDCSWGGTACGKALTGRPAAGKTGTTTDNTNAWFIGFTPQLATAVWLGNDTKHSHQPVTASGLEVFGGDIPAKIWQATMNQALAGAPVLQFPTTTFTGTTSPPPPSTSPSTSPTPTRRHSQSASPSPSPTQSSPSPTLSPSPSSSPLVGGPPSQSPPRR
ncbi:MAG TPA: transglycosylase domain-containing protein [Mycobacteriales bacterium]|nr:transglycosylase domain-containing protein [Mycobacteriales bacterium]